MYLQDIRNHPWNVDKDLKVIRTKSGGIPNIEQECHINVLRVGMKYQDEEEIVVACSYQNYITKLSKSEFFTVKEVLVSDNPRVKDFILEVSGTIENNGLTIRMKMPQFSEEERTRRSKQMKKNMNMGISKGDMNGKQ